MQYTITEEQIKDIALGGGKSKIKTMFPQVFKPKETPESFLDKIFNKDLTIKPRSDKFPNSVFYFDGEAFLVEIQEIGKITIAWVNYSEIYDPISEKFKLDVIKMNKLIIPIIEKRFKLRDIMIGKLYLSRINTIEKHFKYKQTQ